LLRADDSNSSCSRLDLTYSRRLNSDAIVLETKGTLLAWVIGGRGGGVDGGGDGDAEKYDWEGVGWRDVRWVVWEAESTSAVALGSLLVAIEIGGEWIYGK
jgi:hypothetical protein